jgi:hypothetical protein
VAASLLSDLSGKGNCEFWLKSREHGTSVKADSVIDRHVSVKMMAN